MHLHPSRLSLSALAITVGLLLLGSVFAMRITSSAKAASDDTSTTVFSTTAQLAPDAPQLAYHECTIGRVHEWVHDFNNPTTSGGSILIGCTNPIGDIQFFAQPLTDSKRAARILSIALTAKALNKALGIDYYEDAAIVTSCGAGNCRNIARLFMVE